MGLKEKAALVITVVLIFFSALLVTAWYTSSNLEMVWLFIWVAIPIVGFVVGGAFSFILKTAFNISRDFLVGVTIFSVIIFSVLMIEETSLGIIRDQFDMYTNELNIAEGQKTYHEVFLGEGKTLYFHNDKDKSFTINFKHQGNEILTHTQIIRLAIEWLESQGYVVTDQGELYVERGTFRKDMSFELKSGGKVQVFFSVKEDPKHLDQKNLKLYLTLCYKNGVLSFEETARGYEPSK